MSVTASHRSRVRRSLLVRGVSARRTGRVGLVLILLVVGIAFLGPVASPHDPSEIVGIPFETPSKAFPLGTDYLGRDALSRFLRGGGTLLLVAFASTVAAYLVGIPVGIAAARRRGTLDLVTVAFVDLLFSIPGLIFLLVLLTAVGRGLWVAIVGIAIVNIPRVIRIVRSVTIELGTSEFIEAAIARGERSYSVLRRDILANIWTPILADFGLRVTASVFLFASLSYLGLGEPPPAAEWGLMISENRVGLTLQPWVVFAPAVAIAVLMIGVNLVADSVARSVGRSVSDAGV